MNDSLSNPLPAHPVSDNILQAGFGPQALLAQNAFLAMMAAQNGYYNQKGSNPSTSNSQNPDSTPTFPTPFGFMFPPTLQMWNNSMSQPAPIDMISPTDEDHIVRVLLKATRQAHNYNDALNSLDGVNNHSSSAWKDHYLTHHKRFDALVLLESVKEDDAKTEKESKAVTLNLVRKPTPSAKKIKPRIESPPNKFKNASGGESPSEPESSSGCAEDLPDMNMDTSEDEKNMGIPGGGYTDSDVRLFAKHIASQDPSMAPTAVSNSFAERYTGRSGPAWREFYRKRHDVIDLLADRYRSKQVTAVRKQRGRPSWAKGSSSQQTVASPPKVMRMHPGAPSQEKRKRSKLEVEKPIHDLTWKDFT